MKKTFLAKRNALLAFSNLSWGAVALLVALVVLALRLIAPNMFWKISSPVFGAADTLASASHTLLSGFNDTAALAIRNEQLAEQNNALSLENQALQQKVTGLLLLLGREKTGGTESGILARVVARPPTSPYDTLLLAAGTNIGITEGMGVFGAGGVLLGSIEATSADYSQAVLLSAPGVRSDAWSGRNNVPITLLGAGGGAVNASVARSADIVEGDAIFISGPGTLPIGFVTRIDSNPSSPSVTLRITPALNLFSLTWISVRATGATSLISIPVATSTIP